MKMGFLINTLLTPKGSSNSEMYGSWDSECDGFQELCGGQLKAV